MKMHCPVIESSNHNKKTINPEPQAPSIVPQKHPRRRQTPRHLELLSPDCRLVVSLLQFNHPPSLKTPLLSRKTPRLSTTPGTTAAGQRLRVPVSPLDTLVPSNTTRPKGQSDGNAKVQMPENARENASAQNEKDPSAKKRPAIQRTDAPSRSSGKRSIFRMLTWRGDAHRPPSSPSRKSLHE